MDWIYACKKLQEKGLKFEFNAWGWVSKECDFTASIETYRISAQLITDREDWREWCRKLQDCGVEFECLLPTKGGWLLDIPSDFSENKERYRIIVQPIPAGIPKYLESEMAEQKQDKPETPHLEQQIMTEPIIMDGEPLEVGDRVWCFLRGWLKFDGVFHAGAYAYFPLRFIDKNGEQVTYTQAFQNMAGSNRTIYWDEIKITPPPKPKNKVKVWDWFVQWEFQGSTRIDKLCATTEGLVRKTYTGAECIIQKIDGTEREVIQ